MPSAVYKHKLILYDYLVSWKKQRKTEDKKTMTKYEQTQKQRKTLKKIASLNKQLNIELNANDVDVEQLQYLSTQIAYYTDQLNVELNCQLN